MNGARELPEAIQWHEGMLLSPQHFQQLCLRQEELLHHHSRLIAPFHWGVGYLTTDPVLLVNGTYRVMEFEGVMPDGLAVSHVRDTRELEVDLAQFADELKTKPVTINVVVPAKKPGEAPVKGDLARYTSVEGQPIVDDTTGEGEIRIPRLRPNLSLLVGDTIPKKYSGFPIAQVAFKDETFTTTDFIPPVLAIEMQSALGEMASLLSKKLRQKAVFLAERAKSPTMAAEPTLLLETRAMVASLVSGLPQFEAVLYSGNAHPFSLYVVLCGLVGSVASLSAGLLPPVLSPYNHNDLRATFDQAKEFAFRMIDQIHENYMAFSFSFEGGKFVLPMQESWFAPTLTIGVRGRAGALDRDIQTWIEGALIGSASKMQSMRDRRILGAPRTRIEKDNDLGVVPTGGTALFSIKADPQFIEPKDVLQIINSDDFSEANRPVEIMLYVKNK